MITKKTQLEELVKNKINYYENLISELRLIQRKIYDKKIETAIKLAKQIKELND